MNRTEGGVDEGMKRKAKESSPMLRSHFQLSDNSALLLPLISTQRK